jgi:hypothetical protein
MFDQTKIWLYPCVGFVDNPHFRFMGTLPYLRHVEHVMDSSKPWYILLLLGWILNLERWASSKISFLRVGSSGKTRRCPNQIVPFGSCRKHVYFGLFWDNVCLMVLIPLSLAWAINNLSHKTDSTEMVFNLPWGTISRCNLICSLHKVSLDDYADKQ